MLPIFLLFRRIVIKINDDKSFDSVAVFEHPKEAYSLRDLSSHISAGKTFLYADVTCRIVSDSDKQQLVRKVEVLIGEICNWCITNRSIVNDNKTLITEFKPSFPPV